jgi:Cu(I)/Ag(I) efflux system membrane fusion protein
MNRTTMTLAGGATLAVGLLLGWGAASWRQGAGHDAAPVRAGATMPAAPPSSAAGGERKVLYWYDPMVPGQRFDKPGKSPFMDMQLVPRYADEAAAGAGGVAVSPQAQQSLGLREAVAERRRVAQTLDVPGTVLLNERDVAVVQARADGYVERVYGRAPGDVVAAGAPLADVLHPQWLAAQGEYLAVRATGDAALTAAARQRLVLLGMPAGLIERVEHEQRAQAVTTIAAPTGGLIAELMVRQGMTVGAGMTLARINGLATMWVEAAVPEPMAAAVAVGQGAEVHLPAAPGATRRGKVSAVLPEVSRDSRTLRVRIELANPGLALRAGQFVQVVLQGAPLPDAVVVPAESVIRTGRRALVYLVDAPGRYRPVEVELGPEVDGGAIVVRRGVDAGQKVVTSGQFLIDSEASLQGLVPRAPAAQKPESATSAAPPAAAAPGDHAATGTVVAVEGNEITLEHAPVPALKWPAMTMPFELAAGRTAAGFAPGDRVRFTFRKQGEAYVVTSLQREGAASGGRP